ncbi:hypothetical protein [Methylobacterium phyllostachyos]|nr:hypothetical protein [Methylobacterium phyllostachyos]
MSRPSQMREVPSPLIHRLPLPVTVRAGLGTLVDAAARPARAGSAE